MSNKHYPSMRQEIEYTYHVNVRCIVNGVELPRHKFSSLDSYEECYNQVSRYIKENNPNKLPSHHEIITPGYTTNHHVHY